MELGLRGRRALVTGASKGIGLACAAALAEEGCDLVLVARGAADLDAAAARLRAEGGGSVTTRALDLADSRAVDALAAEFPETDILVNNAGAIPGGSLDAVDEARWRAAWDLKVFGYANMCRRFYALMRERGRSVIVNVIGAAGESPDADYIAGSAGNAALMALTRALGGRSPDDGIRVVGINPGPILTDRLEALLRRRAAETLGDPGRWRETMAAMPFGRAGDVREVAALAAFLASDLSSYTSGTVVTVDGGMGSRRKAF
ncbi:short-chain dehydrogenase/reductase [Roseomonas sp. NAR14]|uniref:Short-chain dehydrogenase/reductase n=1 Tax=Roseomonas acroporae TaxID=2937791 RepID=A0A9X1YF94_9PROT|nr:short-chain dehydrogenase/reductase [Roseomonas acroporae]MCK8788045.1 short-chain dehydrogenase/reductase [Roseomonas acroporae]